MKLLILFFLCAHLFCREVQSTEQKKQLTFVTVENVVKMPEVYDKVRQAYDSLNYRVELIEMPSKRALIEAKQNHFIDGDLIRASAAENTLPDHIKIPIPIYVAKIKAYVTNGDINITTWEDLNRYNLVTVRGILATNTKLTDLGFDFKLVSNAQQALDMVKKGRADIAVVIAESIEDDNNFAMLSEQFPYSAVIDERPFYHFIHKKHKALVPELTEVFKLVFADVKFQEYEDEKSPPVH
ncbi:transporter substrate-binding domain-containing protein [Alteromonas sp. 5E99-2]|uniref:substrate-binding periplasmic protein n=1 Tax=Alteromonas sp. 5E99-2 TaxID=2817683 RepID=UPI001A99DD64|nr:transporter substrate-binding domain-containing protein [Alteromonas sp. 5E99-2]MBO1256279.1 transporter substrate-binding domain-containing protein [Alteromonas sp. 5E99-2]